MAIRPSCPAAIVRRVPIETRPIAESELPAWFEAASNVFFFWPWGDPQQTAELRRPTMDMGRTIASFDGDRIVGTYRSFAAKQTLPGLAELSVSGVSAVTVKPTHRRRGLLTSMIGRDIRDSVERGEAAAILYAAEWPIYGRFGYGPATWSTDWRIRTRAARFSRTPAWGSIEIVSRTMAKDTLMEIYDRYRVAQVGEITRTNARWDNDLGLVESPGRPRWSGQVAIHRDASGTPDGYVRYHGEEKWDEGIPDNVVVIDELHGVSIEAEIELWRYICTIDLVAVAKVDGRRTREPVLWYLDDARAVRAVTTYEAQWLRLYDIPVALSARSYDREAS